MVLCVCVFFLRSVTKDFIKRRKRLQKDERKQMVQGHCTQLTPYLHNKTLSRRHSLNPCLTKAFAMELANAHDERLH